MLISYTFMLDPALMFGMYIRQAAHLNDKYMYCKFVFLVIEHTEVEQIYTHDYVL